MSALEELIERHGIGAKFMKMLDSIFGASAPRCASIYPISATSRCALSFLGWWVNCQGETLKFKLRMFCSIHMLVFAGPGVENFNAAARTVDEFGSLQIRHRQRNTWPPDTEHHAEKLLRQ